MAKRYYEMQWEMESHSTPGLFYTVSKRFDGGFECDCKSWIFGRKQHGPDWHCKHIDDVLRRDFNGEIKEALKRHVRGVRLSADGKIASFLETLGDDIPMTEETTVTIHMYTVKLSEDQVSLLRKAKPIYVKDVISNILEQVENQ